MTCADMCSYLLTLIFLTFIFDNFKMFIFILNYIILYIRSINLKLNISYKMILITMKGVVMKFYLTTQL